MKTTISSFALVLGLGIALPIAAQETQGADADQNQMVTAEEATAFDEQRFDEIAAGGDEITQEQFTGALTGAEDAEAAWAEADADQTGGLSREEWLQWRQQRFNEAAGDEGELDAARYQDLDVGGAGDAM